MHYSEHPPSRMLRPYIECIWTLAGSTEHSGSEQQRILPDGCMELILHRGEPFRRGGERQARNFVVGQMMEPVFVQPSNDIDVIGIRFQPGGAFPFFSLPMSELSNRFISLDLFWGATAAELEDRVRGAASTQEAIHAVILELEKRLKPVDGTTARMRRIAALQADELLPVRELARNAGLSERQIEREFKLVVGLTPKTFTRILRFQRVFEAMDNGSRWVDIALECGYYDQSHLIADFRRFAGTTPSSLQMEAFELGRHFLRAHRMSGFSKTFFQ
ncbi:MAG: AraC family transcriptional regulator [Acidobacteria bacterium]|nr:AraC family transcriptional regulator [Acidobacteriota bacterium]